ncbi:hypothetical protein ACFL5N_01740 [bacterium]
MDKIFDVLEQNNYALDKEVREYLKQKIIEYLKKKNMTSSEIEKYRKGINKAVKEGKSLSEVYKIIKSHEQVKQLLQKNGINNHRFFKKERLIKDGKIGLIIKKEKGGPIFVKGEFFCLEDKQVILDLKGERVFGPADKIIKIKEINKEVYVIFRDKGKSYVQDMDESQPIFTSSYKIEDVAEMNGDLYVLSLEVSCFVGVKGMSYIIQKVKGKKILLSSGDPLQMVKIGGILYLKSSSNIYRVDDRKPLFEESCKILKLINIKNKPIVVYEDKGKWFSLTKDSFSEEEFGENKIFEDLIKHKIIIKKDNKCKIIGDIKSVHTIFEYFTKETIKHIIYILQPPNKVKIFGAKSNFFESTGKIKFIRQGKGDYLYVVYKKLHTLVTEEDHHYRKVSYFVKRFEYNAKIGNYVHKKLENEEDDCYSPIDEEICDIQTGKIWNEDKKNEQEEDILIYKYQDKYYGDIGLDGLTDAFTDSKDKPRILKINGKLYLSQQIRRDKYHLKRLQKEDPILTTKNKVVKIEYSGKLYCVEQDQEGNITLILANNQVVFKNISDFNVLPYNQSFELNFINKDFIAKNMAVIKKTINGINSQKKKDTYIYNVFHINKFNKFFSENFCSEIAQYILENCTYLSVTYFFNEIYRSSKIYERDRKFETSRFLQKFLVEEKPNVYRIDSRYLEDIQAKIKYAAYMVDYRLIYMKKQIFVSYTRTNGTIGLYNVTKEKEVIIEDAISILSDPTLLYRQIFVRYEKTDNNSGLYNVTKDEKVKIGDVRKLTDGLFREQIFCEDSIEAIEAYEISKHQGEMNKLTNKYIIPKKRRVAKSDFMVENLDAEIILSALKKKGFIDENGVLNEVLLLQDIRNITLENFTKTQASTIMSILQQAQKINKVDIKTLKKHIHIINKNIKTISFKYLRGIYITNILNISKYPTLRNVLTLTKYQNKTEFIDYLCMHLASDDLTIFDKLLAKLRPEILEFLLDSFNSDMNNSDIAHKIISILAQKLEESDFTRPEVRIKESIVIDFAEKLRIDRGYIWDALIKQGWINKKGVILKKAAELLKSLELDQKWELDMCEELILQHFDRKLLFKEYIIDIYNMRLQSSKERFHKKGWTNKLYNYNNAQFKNQLENALIYKTDRLDIVSFKNRMQKQKTDSKFLEYLKKCDLLLKQICCLHLKPEFFLDEELDYDAPLQTDIDYSCLFENLHDSFSNMKNILGEKILFTLQNNKHANGLDQAQDDVNDLTHRVTNSEEEKLELQFLENISELRKYLNQWMGYTITYKEIMRLFTPFKLPNDNFNQDDDYEKFQKSGKKKERDFKEPKHENKRRRVAKDDQFSLFKFPNYDFTDDDDRDVQISRKRKIRPFEKKERDFKEPKHENKRRRVAEDDDRDAQISRKRKIRPFEKVSPKKKRRKLTEKSELYFGAPFLRKYNDKIIFVIPPLLEWLHFQNWKVFRHYLKLFFPKISVNIIMRHIQKIWKNIEKLSNKELDVDNYCDMASSV